MMINVFKTISFSNFFNEPHKSHNARKCPYSTWLLSFELMLYVPINNFSAISVVLFSGVELVLSNEGNVLLKDNQAP